MLIRSLPTSFTWLVLRLVVLPMGLGDAAKAEDDIWFQYENILASLFLFSICNNTGGLAIACFCHAVKRIQLLHYIYTVPKVNATSGLGSRFAPSVLLTSLLATVGCCNNPSGITLFGSLLWTLLLIFPTLTLGIPILDVLEGGPVYIWEGISHCLAPTREEEKKDVNNTQKPLSAVQIA